MNTFLNQVLESCPSTNDLAKELAQKGCPHGSWVSSHRQTQGRGRNGKKWSSTYGNLSLSLLAEVPHKELWSWIPLTVAVGVLKSLKELMPGIHFQIKWPNDLLWQGLKFGGILCEGIGNLRSHFVVIGIGINCVDTPKGMDQPVTYLSSISEEMKINDDFIRMPILYSVLNEIESLKTQGTHRIRDFYDQCCLLTAGTEVSWGNPPEFGRVKGLGSCGELQVINQAGTLVSVFAETIRVQTHSQFKFQSVSSL